MGSLQHVGRALGANTETRAEICATVSEILFVNLLRERSQGAQTPEQICAKRLGIVEKTKRRATRQELDRIEENWGQFRTFLPILPPKNHARRELQEDI